MMHPRRIPSGVLAGELYALVGQALPCYLAHDPAERLREASRKQGSTLPLR
jgi:hypothetical protein